MASRIRETSPRLLSRCFMREWLGRPKTGRIVTALSLRLPILLDKEFFYSSHGRLRSSVVVIDAVQTDKLR